MVGGRPRNASNAAGSRHVTAVVLAAGRSQRFGGGKQLAKVAGAALLQSTLDVVKHSVVRDIVLVVGHHAEEVTGSIDVLGIEVVFNPAYDEGMSTSIKAGLATLRPDVSGVVMVLGDQPLIRPRTIDRLVEAYGSTDCQAVAPSYEGRRGNPILLDLSLRPQIELLQGDVGCREILDRLDDVEVVEVDDPGILVDVDTRADLDRVRVATLAREVDG